MQEFWVETFSTQILPGPNFSKPSVPGDLRVFRAFASLLLVSLRSQNCCDLRAFLGVKFSSRVFLRVKELTFRNSACLLLNFHITGKRVIARPSSRDMGALWHVLLPLFVLPMCYRCATHCAIVALQVLLCIAMCSATCSCVGPSKPVSIFKGLPTLYIRKVTFFCEF